MDSFAALLRGINVGGKNKLPMAELVKLFEKAGAREVRTYIQSGNVIFQAAPRAAPKLGPDVSALIRKHFKLEVPVVLRSTTELEAVVAGNPFLARGVDAEQLHVMFLADAPQKAALARLDPARSPPDAFEVIGRDIYLHTPNGMARTKFTNAWFDSRLETVSTARNWRTVLKLLELARAR